MAFRMDPRASTTANTRPITISEKYSAGPKISASLVSGAPRADYAAAAATVLTTDGHENAVYELGGDSSFTLSELAAAVTEATGTQVEYREVTPAELTEVLKGAGLPEPVAAVIADVDRAVSEGLLLVDSGELSKLAGRPTGSLKDAVANSL